MSKIVYTVTQSTRTESLTKLLFNNVTVEQHFLKVRVDFKTVYLILVSISATHGLLSISI